MENIDKLKFRIDVYEKMINNNCEYITRLRQQIRELKNTTYRQKREIKKLEDIVIQLSEEIEND